MSKRGGFSLAEVLFALGLISLIAITLLGVIPAAISATKEAGHRAAAARLAEATIEDLGRTSAGPGLQPVSTVTLNGTNYAIQANIQLATPDVAALTSNNPNANPTAVPNLDPNDARIITVTVRWKEPRNLVRTHISRRQLFATH